MSSLQSGSIKTRPKIRLIDSEAERLEDLAVRAAAVTPDVSRLLLAEIDRAEIHTRRTIPRNVVTMNAQVDYLDEASGQKRSIQLVFPNDADMDGGRVSILTPAAAGLIGLAEGQAISWPARDGKERRLVVVKVRQPSSDQPSCPPHREVEA